MLGDRAYKISRRTILIQRNELNSDELDEPDKCIILKYPQHIYPLCSLLPSASGFGVGFGYLNTLGNKVFAALGHRNHQVSGVCSQRVERKDAKSVDAW